MYAEINRAQEVMGESKGGPARTVLLVKDGREAGADALLADEARASAPLGEASSAESDFSSARIDRGGSRRGRGSRLRRGRAGRRIAVAGSGTGLTPGKGCRHLPT